jgi:hypothetical protein
MYTVKITFMEVKVTTVLAFMHDFLRGGGAGGQPQIDSTSRIFANLKPNLVSLSGIGSLGGFIRRNQR